tara:strand:- start:173 stop:358 length:186 start_codon:yes stop_codon:yes gene_type:complete
MIEEHTTGKVEKSMTGLNGIYRKTLNEYNSSPSGSKKEFELGKKLRELDKKIAEKLPKEEA